MGGSHGMLATAEAAEQLALQFVEQAGCLRWRERRARYRPLQECFSPKHHAVDQIDSRTARDFVCRHHYSGSFVADRYNAGLFCTEGRGPAKLVGVATFSVPAGPSVLRKHLGVDLSRGIELGRFVLTDETRAMAESWFAARAMRGVRRALGVDRILACSDPLARYDGAGTLIKVAHGGVIYRATNARFGGRTRPRTLLLMPSGTVFNERTSSKLANGESGAEGALRLLQRAGAPSRNLHEDGRAYLARLVDCGFLRRSPHPGNLVWTWGVTAS